MKKEKKKRQTSSRCNNSLKMWINFSLINDCSLRIKKKEKNMNGSTTKGRGKNKCYYFSWLLLWKREGKLWRANCKHNEKVVFLDGASHKTTRMFLNEIQKMNKLLSMKRALKIQWRSQKKSLWKIMQFWSSLSLTVSLP